MLAQLLRRWPQIHGTLVDLPRIVTHSLRRDVPGCWCDPARHDRRAELLRPQLPAGANIYLLRKILSNWPDREATLILGRCAEAARPTGRVVILGGRGTRRRGQRPFDRNGASGRQAPHRDGVRGARPSDWTGGVGRRAPTLRLLCRRVSSNPSSMLSPPRDGFCLRWALPTEFGAIQDWAIPTLMESHSARPSSAVERTLSVASTNRKGSSQVEK